MKIFNRKFIKGTNWALAGLLSILGFSNCKNEEPYEEYGTPYAGFIVNGKVTDEAGKALSGIDVIVPEVDVYEQPTSSFIPDYPIRTIPVADTLQTASDGTFEYRYGGFPVDKTQIKMKFEGDFFETDSAKVDFLNSDLKGGSGWNSGSATKKVNIKLKAKKQDGK